MPLISKFTNYSPMYDVDYGYDKDRSPKTQKRNQNIKKIKEEFYSQMDKELGGDKVKKNKKNIDKTQGKNAQQNDLKITQKMTKEKQVITQSKVQNVPKKKKSKSCSDRLFALALPKRSTIVQNYQYYQHVLPPKSIEKFKELLDTYSENIYPNH
ncbi:unnamed protein product [Brassicogethes aeneus]|uniref:Uncharacterized protein n=1 Tax=Brassicogethes aeneus TaxID=1431903 RepID=A0A9P0BCQ6_BRAAE|nr:unnamed protein product [Brassicogethes aeneus]